MNPFLIVGLIGTAVFFLQKWSKAAALQSLNIVVKNFNVSCGGFLCTSPELTVNLLLQNPTDQVINLRSIIANIFVNGQYIGNANALNVKAIAANSQDVYPLTVDLQITTILGEALAILQGDKNIQAVLELKGTVNVEGINYPLNLKFKVV